MKVYSSKNRFAQRSKTAKKTKEKPAISTVFLCRVITVRAYSVYHFVQTMLTNIAIDLSTISKNRTITATKSDVMELLYFKVSCIVHFPTHVALNGDHFMFSGWNLFVVYHSFS